MWYKSYVSEVVDPLFGHQAIGMATRPWTRPLTIVRSPIQYQAIGTPLNYGSEHQLLDPTGLEHQHWITAAGGIIETLTLDPMTWIFCPFISCLLHTKTGQHSLPHCI